MHSRKLTQAHLIYLGFLILALAKLKSRKYYFLNLTLEIDLTIHFTELSFCLFTQLTYSRAGVATSVPFKENSRSNLKRISNCKFTNCSLLPLTKFLLFSFEGEELFFLNIQLRTEKEDSSFQFFSESRLAAASIYSLAEHSNFTKKFKILF